MKYNTFWGYVFWTLLLISTLADLRPVLINFWGLIYNGTIGNLQWVLWIPTHIFLISMIVLKISLLRWFFPRNTKKLYDWLGTKEICGLCAGMSTFYALIVLLCVLLNGGLKSMEMWQTIQAVSSLVTPFILIYYLVREEER